MPKEFAASFEKVVTYIIKEVVENFQVCVVFVFVRN